MLRPRDTVLESRDGMMHPRAAIKALVLVSECLDYFDHIGLSLQPVSPIWSCLPVVLCPVRTEPEVEMCRLGLCHGLISCHVNYYLIKVTYLLLLLPSVQCVKKSIDMCLINTC